MKTRRVRSDGMAAVAAPVTDWSGANSSKYYRNPVVRNRIQEFLGSAAYIVGNDGSSLFGEMSSPDKLGLYLRKGLEVERSLWDRDLLIVHVDLEYHNFDNPAAPWLEPERCFRLQEPVLNETLRLLRDVSIEPLSLVTGRGFHLAWAVRRGTTAFRRLAETGYIPASLTGGPDTRCSHCRIDAELQCAFAGLGMIMEFLWHRVFQTAQLHVSISLQPMAIEVGAGPRGREIIAFDLSEYGDPLETRHIRIPFSAYLKPVRFEWLLGKEELRKLLPIFEIPLAGMDPMLAIRTARNPTAVSRLARHTSVAIPDESETMNALLDEYERSDLQIFHDWFHREVAISQQQAPGSLQVSGVPGCVQWLVDNPNDWLLRPAALQHVVRTLMALGYSPPSIVRFIEAAYSRDCEWQDTWDRLDLRSRAIFYTRVFAGAILTRTDTLVDFNCVSHREKGYCTNPDCRSNLATYRDMLARRTK